MESWFPPPPFLRQNVPYEAVFQTHPPSASRSILRKKKKKKKKRAAGRALT